MSYIFVSYSKKNADYAHRLADTLRAEGFEVWIDKRRLATGEDWWKSIVLALRSCSAFVVIMTPESDGSRWVQREITLAEKYEKPVFPLWLAGDMDTPNWELFVRTQYEDVRGGVLPGAEFYARLEAYALRQRGSAMAQEQPAVPEQPDNSDDDLEEEIANPPPLNETIPSPPVHDQPLIPRLNPSRRAGPLVFVAALGVIAVTLLVLAVSQAGQPTNASPTATGTTQVVAQASLEPTATPPSDNATAIYTSTPTPTPTVTVTTQSTTPNRVISARAKSNAVMRILTDNKEIVLDGLNPTTGVILLSRDSTGGQVEVQVTTDLIGWLLITELTDLSGDVNTLSVNGAAPTIRQASVTGTVRANLRRGPGSSFSVFQSLEPGTTVIALGRTDPVDWMYVNASGIIGWMSASVLDIEGNQILLPVVQR